MLEIPRCWPVMLAGNTPCGFSAMVVAPCVTATLIAERRDLLSSFDISAVFVASV
jgi:hypothetical protein